jgi:cell wall-associated NlpC family hydrolase
VTAERDRLASVQRTLQRITEKRREGLARLSASRNRITAMLQRRRALLALVKQEIRAIRVHEHRQQLILAAQARARFARERQTLARQAAVRAEAARANHARAATTTTPAPDAKPLAPSSTTATAPQQTTTDAAVAPQPTTPAALPPPAPAGPGHVDAASIALRYLGVPYRWGGASPGGFDCSGLVMYVFAQLGISLPHYAAAQYGFGTPVPRDQIQPGDLVFFDGLSHVGIAIGNGQMVHAPHTGDVVRISNISDFGAGYVGARRI